MTERCKGCEVCGPLPTRAPQFAIVAHGQPGNPSALQPELEALAARVSTLLPFPVAGATLACPRSLSALKGVGAIYPLFMAGGWFVNSEMPRRLKAAGVEGYQLLRPFGLDKGLPALGARLADAAARNAGINPAKATLVVVGHGSGKGPAAADSARAFAAAMPHGFARLEMAFIEEPPFIADLTIEGPAVCLPFFATNGAHTTGDIPDAWAKLGAPGPIAPPIGTVGQVAELIAATLRAA